MSQIVVKASFLISFPAGIFDSLRISFNFKLDVASSFNSYLSTRSSNDKKSFICYFSIEKRFHEDFSHVRILHPKHSLSF